MNSTDGTLFLLAALFLITVSVWYKIKSQKLDDARATVQADKRSELQYELRRAKTMANNLVTLLIGVLLGIIIVFALGKPQPNQGEKFNSSQDTINHGKYR